MHVSLSVLRRAEQLNYLYRELVECFAHSNWYQAIQRPTMFVDYSTAIVNSSIQLLRSPSPCFYKEYYEEHELSKHMRMMRTEGSHKTSVGVRVCSYDSRKNELVLYLGVESVWKWSAPCQWARVLLNVLRISPCK
jgi:hypothetical protein